MIIVTVEAEPYFALDPPDLSEFMNDLAKFIAHRHAVEFGNSLHYSDVDIRYKEKERDTIYDYN